MPRSKAPRFSPPRRVSPTAASTNRSPRRTRTATRRARQDRRSLVTRRAGRTMGSRRPTGTRCCSKGPVRWAKAPSAATSVLRRDKNGRAAGWSTRSLLPVHSSRVRKLGDCYEPSAIFDPSPDLSHAMVDRTANLRLPPLSAVGKRCRAAAVSQLVPTRSSRRRGWRGRRPEDPVGSLSMSSEARRSVDRRISARCTSPMPGRCCPKTPSARRTRGRADAQNRFACGLLRRLRRRAARGGRAARWCARSVRRGARRVVGHGRAARSATRSRPMARVRSSSVPTRRRANRTAGQNNCAVDPPELYVRENGDRDAAGLEGHAACRKSGGCPPRAPDGRVADAQPVVCSTGMLEQTPGRMCLRRPMVRRRSSRATDQLDGCGAGRSSREPNRRRMTSM